MCYSNVCITEIMTYMYYSKNVTTTTNNNNDNSNNNNSNNNNNMNKTVYTSRFVRVILAQGPC